MKQAAYAAFGRLHILCYMTSKRPAYTATAFPVPSRTVENTADHSYRLIFMFEVIWQALLDDD